MLRAVVVGAVLGAILASGSARAQLILPGLNFDIQSTARQQRTQIRPYVLGLTNCVARRALDDDAAVIAFRDDGFSPYVRTLIEQCPRFENELSQAYDQTYGEGQGQAFIDGAYAKDLPRAVLARIRPQLQAKLDTMRKDEAAAAERAAQEKAAAEAQARQAEADRQRAAAEQADLDARAKAEEAERERQAEIERQRVAAEQADRDARARDEEAARERQAELERQRAAAEQADRDARAKVEEAARERKAEAERQRAAAEAEQQAATARADAEKAKAQERAAAQIAEAERLKQVDTAKSAAKLLAVKALDCARDQLRSLVKSGESAEVLADAVTTICSADVDNFVESGAKEYALENQIRDDDAAAGSARAKLRSETRGHFVALAVQAKAGVGSFAN